MPYFSFSIKENINLIELKNIEFNKTYFSKNTAIWKSLNVNTNKNKINFVKFEKRKKNKLIKNKVLFYLPPNIGLGDAIEYASAINIVNKKLKLKKVGIAFTDKYYYIFKKFFNLNVVYKDVISLEELDKYNSIFHLTLEIQKLKLHEYSRSGIIKEICRFFKISYQTSFVKKEKDATLFGEINTISIFPISTSPIRTMSVYLLNEIIYNFGNSYNVEIFFDDNLHISKFVEKNITNNGYIKKKPTDVNSLIQEIDKIQFGIFIDSGPLHVANMLNKSGIFLESSVSGNILIRNKNKINIVKNKYTSKYCSAPCGLIDIFNFNNKIGCYDTIGVKKEQILDFKFKHQLRRGIEKSNLLFYLSNPVGCIRSINNNKIINIIKNKLKK